MKPSLLFATLCAGGLAVNAQAQEYGTIKATTTLRADGTKCITILDPEKHTSEETVTDANNRVLGKTTYLLGDRDVVTGAIFYNAKGAPIYKAAYQRDPSGNISEVAFSTPDDRYLGKRVYVYSKDAALQVINYDANGQLIAPTAPAETPKASKKRH